MKDEHLNTLRH